MAHATTQPTSSPVQPASTQQRFLPSAPTPPDAAKRLRSLRARGLSRSTERLGSILYGFLLGMTEINRTRLSLPSTGLEGR